MPKRRSFFVFRVNFGSELPQTQLPYECIYLTNQRIERDILCNN